MKKPDCFIAFDWPKFQASTTGMRREIKWSYWTACCAYYWGECAGLADDDESLRSICECFDESKWPATKAAIFGPFFKLDGGRWHQKRTREEWERAVDHVEKMHKRAVSAATQRWGNECLSISSSNACALPKTCPTPTPTPTSVPTPTPTPDKLQKQTNGAFGYPSLEEVKANAAIIGMSDTAATEFWNHFESSGWIDKNGNPVRNWRAKQANWKVKNQAAPYEAAHHAREDGLSGVDKMILSKELERVETRLRQINDGAAQDAMGSKYFTDSDKAKRAELITRRKELRAKLGIQI